MAYTSISTSKSTGGYTPIGSTKKSLTGYTPISSDRKSLISTETPSTINDLFPDRQSYWGKIKPLTSLAWNVAKTIATTPIPELLGDTARTEIKESVSPTGVKITEQVNVPAYKGTNVVLGGLDVQRIGQAGKLLLSVPQYVFRGLAKLFVVPRGDIELETEFGPTIPKMTIPKGIPGIGGIELTSGKEKLGQYIWGKDKIESATKEATGVAKFVADNSGFALTDRTPWVIGSALVAGSIFVDIDVGLFGGTKNKVLKEILSQIKKETGIKLSKMEVKNLSNDLAKVFKVKDVAYRKAGIQQTVEGYVYRNKLATIKTGGYTPIKYAELTKKAAVPEKVIPEEQLLNKYRTTDSFAAAADDAWETSMLQLTDEQEALRTLTGDIIKKDKAMQALFAERKAAFASKTEFGAHVGDVLLKSVDEKIDKETISAYKRYLDTKIKPVQTIEPLTQEAKQYKSAEEFVKAETITLYRAAPKFPKDNFAKDTYFANKPETARYYSESHYKGEPSDITVKEFTFPKTTIRKEGSAGSFRLNENYSVSKDIKSQLTDIWNKATKGVEKKIVKKTITPIKKAISKKAILPIKKVASKKTIVDKMKGSKAPCVVSVRNTLKKDPNATVVRGIFDTDVDNAVIKYVDNLKRDIQKHLDGFTHVRAISGGKIIESKVGVPKGAKFFSEADIKRAIKGLKVKPETILQKGTAYLKQIFAKGQKKYIKSISEGIKKGVARKFKALKKTGERLAIISKTTKKISGQAERRIERIKQGHLTRVKQLETGRERIVKRLLDKKAEIKSIKTEIYDYTKKVLPLAKRGKLLTNVTKAETRGDLSAAFRKIINERNRIVKKDIVNKIEKMTDRLDRLPIKWQDKIVSELGDNAFIGMSPKTIENLVALREFLSTSPEAKYLFGKKTLRRMKRIADLEKKKLVDMDYRELTELYAKVDRYYREGDLAAKVIKRTEKLVKQRTLRTLESQSNNIDVQIPKTIGSGQTAKQKLGNAKYQIADQTKDGYMNYISADVAFEIFDNNVRRGINYRTFKETFDTKFVDAKEMNALIVDDYFKVKKGLEKQLERKFTTEELNEITIHAATKQVGGRQKLLDSGITIKQIDDVKLSPQQLELYNYQREGYDAMHPLVDETLRRTQNRKLGKVDNYTSWQTDFDNSDEIFKRLESDYIQSSRTSSTFTKERTYGRQQIRLNAEDIYLRHMNDVTYYVHTEELLSKLGKLARDPSYANAIGRKGQQWVLGWIDLMARKGVPGGYRPNWVTTVLRNIGGGILGFRLSPIAKQPLAKITSAALLGKHTFAYDPQFWGKGLKKYVQKISKQQRFRSFDDPAYVELAKNKKLAKWQEWGYAGIKTFDGWTADSVWYAAYRKYFSDKKLKFNLDDFKAGKANKDALEYADYITRRTQGTGEIKDLPRMLTGRDKGIWKAIFQFQSFVLNESYLIPHDAIGVALRTEKNPVKAAWIIAAYLAAGVAEDYVQSGMASIFSSKERATEEWEKPFWKRLIDATVGKVPILSNLYGIYRFDSTGIPITALPEDLVSGLGVFTSNTTEGKIKAASRLAEAMAKIGGVAGAGQAGQITRKFVGESDTSTRMPGLPRGASTDSMPGLPRGSSSSRLPGEPR